MADPTVTVDVSSVEAVRGTKTILDQFGRIIRTVKQVDQETDRSFKKVGQQMQRVAQQSQKSANSVNGMSNRLRNLGSSAIFAIGPLSGVGARIVAFTAIANRANFAVAALIATFAAVAVAAFKLSSRMIEVSIATDRIINSLRISVGSTGRARAEFRFVEREVARLGIDLEVSARQFSQLSAAAKGTTLQGAEVRKIFTAVAQAATVLQLSTDATQGAFRAIQQIMSKGTVQAEELRGQLGERLPGAFQIAARAMGKTTQELNKMLEQGELLSEDFLPRFAVELNNAFGPGVEDAVNTLTAETNKLQTALFGVFQELDRITGLSDVWDFFVKQLRLLAEDTKKVLSDPTAEDIIRDRADEIKARLAVLQGAMRVFGDQATRFLPFVGQQGQEARTVKGVETRALPPPVQPVVPGKRRAISGIQVRAVQPPNLASNLIEAARLQAELNKLQERAVELGFQLEAGTVRRKSLIIDLSKAEVIQLEKERKERIKLDKFENKLLATLKRKPDTIRQITEAQKQGDRAARVAVLTIQAENRLIKRGITLTADRTTEIRKLTTAIEAEEEALRRTRTGLAELARGEQIFDTLSDAGVRGLKSLEDSLVSIVTASESAGDAFKGFARVVIAEIQRMIIARTIIRPLSGLLDKALGSLIPTVGVGSGSEISTGVFATGQHGASFTVGGQGGPDSRLFPIAVSPGERVDILTPGQQARGGSTVIQSFDFRGASLEAVALLERKAAEIKAETIAAVHTSGIRGGSIAKLPKV